MKTVEALYELAKKHLEENALEEGIPHLKEAADLGHVKAQYNLAIFLHQGIGSKQSHDEAFHYFDLAAQQHHPRALYMVGCYYFLGLVVTQSEELAVHYFEQAAELGNDDAQYNLGVLLIKSAPAKAFQYFKRATEQGHLNAEYNLGICYAQGIGVLPSRDDAIHYLELAVKHRHPKAAEPLEMVLMSV